MCYSIHFFIVILFILFQEYFCYLLFGDPGLLYHAVILERLLRRESKQKYSFTCKYHYTLFLNLFSFVIECL